MADEDEVYRKARLDVFPKLDKALENNPVGYSGDWVDLDRRLRKMWDAAIKYASEQLTEKKDSDEFNRGWNDNTKKTRKKLDDAKTGEKK